jgi:hypothetical protein
VIGHWIAEAIYRSIGVGHGGQANTAYSFWSGFGSDLQIMAAVGLYVRHVNCHVKGCPRVGKHQIDGTPYKVCHKHHPEVPDGGLTEAHLEVMQ